MRLLRRIYYFFVFLVKKPQDVTIHPRYDMHIKYGFSVGNRHYYRCLHDYDIRENRFRYLKTYWQEVQNKLTSQDINDFCDKAIQLINENKIVEAGKILDEMKYRSTWLFEPTSLYKYASVLYFDLSENIKDYDVEYNHEKIRIWSKKKTLLRMLLKDLMTGAEELLALSNNDFNYYITKLQEAKDKQEKLVYGNTPSKNNESIEVTI